METITMTNYNDTDRTEPIQEAANDEDLLSLFNQYTGFMSPTLDWLSTDLAFIINEVSLERISATYHIKIQQCTTTALFDTDGNMLDISQKIDSLPQKPKLLKSNI